MILQCNTAVVSTDIEDEQTKRDRHIIAIGTKGMRAWQKAHAYGRRNLVETAIGRYRSLIGDRLHVRRDDSQETELAIGIKVLNQMTRVAKPVSVRVGC